MTAKELRRSLEDEGRSRRRRGAWREESDTAELAQQLLVASEQTRRGLEAELRKCAGKLEQADFGKAFKAFKRLFERLLKGFQVTKGI